MKTREVTFTVRLPIDIADQAEEVHAAEPEFLGHVVSYGLMRRSVLRYGEERKERQDSALEEAQLHRAPRRV